MTDNGSPVASAPAFVILLGLCASIALHESDYSAALSAAAALLAASAWMCLGSRRFARGWPHLFVIILLFILAASFWSFHKMSFSGNFPFSSFETDAKVVMNRPWGKSCALLLETPYGRAVAYRFGRGAPPDGSVVHIRGAAFDLKRSEDPRGFDEFLFWHARGAVKKIIVFELRTISRSTGLARWRSLFERRIRDTLPERTASYMLALTTGTRDERLTEVHMATGTQHLLAVSGFHVGIIAGLAMLLFRSGLARCVGVSAVVWLYVIFAGAPAGGLRAALMLQIYLLGLAAGKPSSAFNSVSMAGVLLLLFNPWYYFDIGWRLSMCAALFITAMYAFMPKSTFTAIVASMLVWTVTAPIAAYAFDTLPLAGLFVNILAVPLFAALFPAMMICSLPALLGIKWFAFLADGCEYLMEAWDLFSELVLEYAPWEVAFSPALALLGAAVFFAAAAVASGFVNFSPKLQNSL